MCLVVERQLVSVGRDGADAGLHLTPPVSGEVEEGFGGTGDRNQDVLSLFRWSPSC